MEIRLIGSPEEIDAAVTLIGQSFTIHQDGGSYQGRNPRYAIANQSNRIRRLVVSPKPATPRSDRAGQSSVISHQSSAPVANNYPATPKSAGVQPLEVD